MKGLIIKSPWIDYILSGKKKWEIRSSKTKKREEVLLIKSGTSCIYGKATIINCFQLSLEEFKQSYEKHMIPIENNTKLPYTKTFAWVLENPIAFETPIPYKHPKGAIVWVDI